nr:hypothetical protein [Mesorhizobium sp. ES1-3]
MKLASWPVKEGLDFIHVDSPIAVFVDGVEYTTNEVLNFGLRERAIAVGISYREHHSHARLMQGPGAVGSPLHPVPLTRVHAEAAIPKIAAPWLGSRTAILLHLFLITSSIIWRTIRRTSSWDCPLGPGDCGAPGAGPAAAGVPLVWASAGKANAIKAAAIAVVLPGKVIFVLLRKKGRQT